MQSLVHSLPESMDFQDVKSKRPRHQNDIRAFSGNSSFSEANNCAMSEVSRRPCKHLECLFLAS